MFYSCLTNVPGETKYLMVENKGKKNRPMYENLIFESTSQWKQFKD